MTKRTLEAFFKPTPPTPPKRPKPNPDNHNPSSHHNPPQDEDTNPPSHHPSYPIPIPTLPSHIEVSLTHGTPARAGRTITNQPHLDLLYFQPYIARATANELFKFLRRELPFYRVKYQIKRGGLETQITTPRYTTVFGVDETSRFIPASDLKTKTKTSANGSIPSQGENTRTSNPDTSPSHPPNNPPTSDLILVHTETNTPIPPTKYQYTPRPLPSCLNHLRERVQAATGAEYNFCLVNYYASGEDSIAFHSDDERFLGGEPDIASLSLGGEREFVMKHKPSVPGPQRSPSQQAVGGAGQYASGNVSGRGPSPTSTSHPIPSPSSSATGLGTTNSHSSVIRSQPQTQAPQIKMPLSSGDMVIMRGATQANWLHSIPKRKGRSGDAVRGRINITFRRAVGPGGTDNYYRYNVGAGGVYRWDEMRQEMVLKGE